MKWIKHQEKWTRIPWYTGKKDKFEFICSFKGTWWALVAHVKKDIKFNTLDAGIKFDTIEELQEWCEAFLYTEWNCFGEDAQAFKI